MKLSKEKGCEVVGRWKKACIRHFYWCVTSTPSNQDEVKYAKFESFFSHILNKHINLPNKIFNKCAHGIITQSRVWLTKSRYTVPVIVWKTWLGILKLINKTWPSCWHSNEVNAELLNNWEARGSNSDLFHSSLQVRLPMKNSARLWRKTPW